MLTVFAQATLPPPDVIRQTAAEVVSRTYYELGETGRSDSPPWWWAILRWLLKPFEWLFVSMEGWPDFVRWTIVILLFILLLALIAHIVYSFAVAIRGPAARRRGTYTSTHVEIDPTSLEQEAERAGKGGDYIGAIRLLFRAALRRIEVAEKKKLRPGFTNRELLRRYRSTPLFNSLERFVETIDQKWYGGAMCAEEDFLTCRSEHARIRQHVQESRTAIDA
jgi:hypothetical protein